MERERNFWQCAKNGHGIEVEKGCVPCSCTCGSNFKFVGELPDDFVQIGVARVAVFLGTSNLQSEGFFPFFERA